MEKYSFAKKNFEKEFEPFKGITFSKNFSYLMEDKNKIRKIGDSLRRREINGYRIGSYTIILSSVTNEFVLAKDEVGVLKYSENFESLYKIAKLKK